MLSWGHLLEEQQSSLTLDGGQWPAARSSRIIDGGKPRYRMNSRLGEPQSRPASPVKLTKPPTAEATLWRSHCAARLSVCLSRPIQIISYFCNWATEQQLSLSSAAICCTIGAVHRALKWTGCAAQCSAQNAGQAVLYSVVHRTLYWTGCAAQCSAQNVVLDRLCCTV